MAGEVAELGRREALLAGVFAVLDQQRRGVVSRVELAHILDAMQADASVRFPVPEGLRLTDLTKDSGITLADLRELLAPLNFKDLEDVKWFAESVVKVESELRDVWRAAVLGWREQLERLYSRDLHRYLLASQPERISRWLLLRTSMEAADGSEDGTIGQLGLGISQHEVEVLFADDTADDINDYSAKMEPFLSALELRDSFFTTCCAAGGRSGRGADGSLEVDARATELLNRLLELGQGSRDLACLLIHTDTLSFVTAVIQSAAFAQAVVVAGSKLIMALLTYRVHENGRNFERFARQLVAEYLEIGFDPAGFDFAADYRHWRQSRTDGERLRECRATVADWVGSLVSLPADFDRGEMLEVLIRYDERRLQLQRDGGERHDEESPVSSCLFSHGRVVSHLLRRVDLCSHHSLHEHRTPMRAHLWKLLLNILSSAGERGRPLFRAGSGMRILCDVVRGNSWGAERGELTQTGEDDRGEQAEVAPAGVPSPGTNPDANQSWSEVEYFDSSPGVYRYYAKDFHDDEFYGPKDRMLAATFLEYMASDALWGPEGVVEEMVQYPNTLQVLTKAWPPSCFLVGLLLTSRHFPEYLRRIAVQIAERSCVQPTAAEQLYYAQCGAHGLSLRWHGGQQQRSTCEALESFRQEYVQMKSRNTMLRVLIYSYHNLLATRMQPRESVRFGTFPQSGFPEEATQPEEEKVHECCRLMAAQLQATPQEAKHIVMDIHRAVSQFSRKVLLFQDTESREREAEAKPPAAEQEAGHVAMDVHMLVQLAKRKSQPDVEEASAAAAAKPQPPRVPGEFLVLLRMMQLFRLREDPDFTTPIALELQRQLESFVEQGNRETTAGEQGGWASGNAMLDPIWSFPNQPHWLTEEGVSVEIRPLVGDENRDGNAAQ